MQTLKQEMTKTKQKKDTELQERGGVKIDTGANNDLGDGCSGTEAGSRHRKKT